MTTETRTKRYLEHLWGPSGSIILHILLVILLYHLISLHAPPKADTYSVKLTPDTKISLDDPPPEDLPNDPTPMDNMAPHLPTEPQFTETPPDIPEPELFALPENFSPLSMPLPADTLKPLSGMYSGRSSEGIGERLNRYSGGFGRVTEPAVIRALQWLREHQNPNGSWGPLNLSTPKQQKYATGLTGLAVLTFLAHGETPQKGSYATCVKRGLDFLIQQQDPQTGSFSESKQTPGNHDYAPYAHAIATYAISEAYGLTRIASLQPVMNKAIETIINGQMPDGTWAYGYDNARNARRDLSVTGWQIQALKAAALAGATHPRLFEALSNAVNGVEGMQLPNRRFAYSATNPQPDGSGTDSMTGVGVLCLQILGYGQRSAARSGLQALREVKCQWDATPWGEALHDARSYDYYYITQAKFQQGKQSWKQWNKQMARELVAAQHPTGYWLGPASADTIIHKVYNTTLAALTLQVYYRFLPTYQPIKLPENISVSEEDDVAVRII